MVSVTYDNHDPYITRKTNNYTIYIVSKGSVDNAISRLEWCDRYTTCDMKILMSRSIKPACHLWDIPWVIQQGILSCMCKKTGEMYRLHCNQRHHNSTVYINVSAVKYKLKL